MSTNTIIVVVIAAIIALGAWWYFSRGAGGYNVNGSPRAENAASGAAAAIQSRDNSDASLTQDAQTVDAQLGQLTTDAAAAGQ
ncbi:hypothetical protein HY091_00505 [Candidatus Kaiserbacteria bacterium]|nr:hypothetical protein [Candidatus Kaiserbacteria bacterium]